MTNIKTTLPDVNIGITDGGLGRIPSLGIGNTILIGTSVIATEKPIRIRNRKDIAKLGEGILSDELKDLCDVATPPQLYAYSILPDIMLSPKVKKEGSTQETKLPTVEGESQTAWEATFTIISEGGPNVATFEWTLEGIKKEAQTISTDKKFIIGETGVSITFKDNYMAGDSFTVFTQGKPKVSDAKWLEAIENVSKFRLDVEFITIVNPVSQVVLAGFAKMLEDLSLAPHHYYLWGLACREGLIAYGGDIEAYLKTLESEIKNYRSKRLAVVAIEAKVISQAKEKYKVPIGALAGFISSKSVAQGLNEFANSALPTFTGVYPENIDQSVQKDLADMGYLCFRTVHNLEGVFITDPRTTEEITSDYYRIENMRVANKACQKVRTATLPFINSQLQTDSQGRLQNVGVIRMTAESGLKSMQGNGDLSDFRVLIDEYQDVLSSEVLEMEIKIVPMTYLKWLSITMGYENPNTNAGV